MVDANDALVFAALSESLDIAVIGVKDSAAEPAFYVPDYLARVGYRIHGVNPKFANRELFGRPVRARLDHVMDRIDLVEVFRAPEHLDGVADEILQMWPRPRYAWFQLGIRNDAAAAKLEAGGVRVIQDRCMMPEHRRLLGPGRR